MGEMLRACSRCGRPFKPRHARHYHCEQHERRGNEHRSPTTRHRPSSSTERDRLRAAVVPPGTVCAIQLSGCTEVADVMDHIVPVAAGGTHELSNLRPACAHCNSVLGGQQASALKDGAADHSGSRISRGVARPAQVGPTRLA